MVRDFKTKEMKYVKKYYNIGQVDEARYDNDQPNGTIKGFSIDKQQREAQKQASALKIQKLRRHFGNLINTVDNK